ncbi:formyltetrahydrofolate deformylase [Gaiella sp.]|jgi:formyltetrahydrofolate deformylase|uniref:formyltetrahydrofolate deformylase n=1 Tax=Gaiella sp. TaxID=2663207 RepID=UPI002E37DA15|nr:formyltetrahydrofolate deformylase [Gaiella sp.]HEX5584592.1 formyltetrahydrofolate deformylase [Gaiella sp.]
MSDVGRLIVSCPDRRGIVAALSTVLAETGANIIRSDQHSTNPEGGDFFLRMEFHLEGLAEHRVELERRIGALGAELELDWRLTSADSRKRVAIFVSRYEHCLLDLLWRWRTGELEMDIVGVVSNHPDLAIDVGTFGIPFHHVPVTRETKLQAEQAQLDLFAGRIDLIVLARYMQVLSGDFLQRVAVPVINIHHSFLPSFAGADPYTRAYDRGVKLIGATAHYATEDLDEGPIIEQDTHRVSHSDSPEELTRIGRDIERLVLARAVRSHLDDRIVVHGNRTIVF